MPSRFTFCFVLTDKDQSKKFRHSGRLYKCIFSTKNFSISVVPEPEADAVIRARVTFVGGGIDDDRTPGSSSLYSFVTAKSQTVTWAVLPLSFRSKKLGTGFAVHVAILSVDIGCVEKEETKDEDEAVSMKPNVKKRARSEVKTEIKTEVSAT